MTYTKRQFFIYRIEQCKKLLKKIEKYSIDIQKYVERTKYRKRVNRIFDKIVMCQCRLTRFLDKIKK